MHYETKPQHFIIDPNDKQTILMNRQPLITLFSVSFRHRKSSLPHLPRDGIKWRCDAKMSVATWRKLKILCLRKKATEITDTIHNIKMIKVKSDIRSTSNIYTNLPVYSSDPKWNIANNKYYHATINVIVRHARPNGTNLLSLADHIMTVTWWLQEVRITILRSHKYHTSSPDESCKGSHLGYGLSCAHFTCGASGGAALSSSSACVAQYTKAATDRCA